jgi:hypothetical protein
MVQVAHNSKQRVLSLIKGLGNLGLLLFRKLLVDQLQLGSLTTFVRGNSAFTFSFPTSS